LSRPLRRGALRAALWLEAPLARARQPSGGTTVLGGVFLALNFPLPAASVYATTPNYISADIAGTGLIGISAGPAAVQIAAVLALAAWVALPLPVFIAGFIRLRGWRRGKWLRAVAWAGAWMAGAVLLELALALGNPPGVSWGELAVCAAWLALGAVMTWILAAPGPPRARRVEQCLKPVDRPGRAGCEGGCTFPVIES